MAISNIGNVTYSDFKMLEVIDPEQFDKNNEDLCQKIDEIVDLVNQYLSTDLDSSGADNIYISQVGSFSADTVQKFIEQLNSKLTSSGSGDSGADYVKAGNVSGLTGNTVQSLLESLKTYVDTYNANHKVLTSTDHDNRYYTKTQIDAINYDSRYYTETESDTIFATKDELITFTLGDIVDNTLTTAKMATEQKRGVANGVASLDGTGNVPLSQLGNLPVVDFTPVETDIENLQNDLTTLDVFAKDAGRHQSEFGFTNSTYNDTTLTGNSVSISNSADKQINQLTTGATGGDSVLNGVASLSVTQTTRCGQKFNSTLTANIDFIRGVEIYVDSYSGIGGGLICTVYDATLGTALATQTVLGASITTGAMLVAYNFNTPVAFTRGNELQIRFYAMDANKSFNIGAYDRAKIANTNAIKTTNSWGSTTNIDASLAYRLNYTTNSKIGTVVKTIIPDNIESWANLKWDELGNDNTTVTCDVLKGNDIVAEYAPPNYTTSMFIRDSYWSAQKFTSAISTASVNVTVPIYRDSNTNLIRNDLQIHIYTVNSSTGVPQTSIGSSTISYLNVPNTTYDVPYLMTTSISLSENILKGQSYFILLKEPTAGTLNYRWSYHSNLIHDGSGLAYESTNSGGTWVQKTDYNYPYKVFVDPIVVYPDIKSYEDLYDIDIAAYPSLKVRWTLERVSTSDASPIISNPSYTWIGANILTKVDPITKGLVLRSDGEKVDFDTETKALITSYVLTTNNSNSITFEIPSGYKQYVIEYVAKTTKVINSQSSYIIVNNRTGQYDYNNNGYSYTYSSSLQANTRLNYGYGPSISGSATAYGTTNYCWTFGDIKIYPSNSINRYTTIYSNGDMITGSGITNNSVSKASTNIAVCIAAYEPPTIFKLYLDTDYFVSGSEFRLYGIK